VAQLGTPFKIVDGDVSPFRLEPMMPPPSHALDQAKESRRQLLSCEESVTGRTTAQPREGRVPDGRNAHFERE
jgi:hypothetical protein